MQCTNNLKQIGLATHNYHDKFGTMPHGQESYQSSPSRRSCFLIGLLPYLEEQTLSNLVQEKLQNPQTIKYFILETRLSTK
ncbi:DUF1559 family PulG-like putative transporter [Bremerella alba]|uniref:DUF1559 domain-containing protein n=1 Tax=Bremerella alba TaxID=980252 RepID=A0A7V9A9R7_9BACT|nr:DUF1559 domain-containing protein [Bremerella alba]MBA2117830.1 hypothetical protein [Bremerella alba]